MELLALKVPREILSGDGSLLKVLLPSVPSLFLLRDVLYSVFSLKHYESNFSFQFENYFFFFFLIYLPI